MSMLITWTLGALALVPAQDEGRAAAVRAQLEKEVQGKAPVAQAPAPAPGAAEQEDPILELLQQIEKERTAALNKLNQLGSAVRPILPRYLGQISPIALKETLEFLLREAPDAEAVAALERLLGGADPVARVIVARSLDDVRGPARKGLIDRALASADPRVRHETLRALGQREYLDPRFATAVGELARSASNDERRLAAELCASFSLRELREIDALVDTLFGDTDREVRTLAIDAWLDRSSKLGDAEALAFYARLDRAEERSRFVNSVVRGKRPWPRLFDRAIAEGVPLSKERLSEAYNLYARELVPQTLLEMVRLDRTLESGLIVELQRRRDPAGVEFALERLLSSQGASMLFAYLREVAPERLVPFGRHLMRLDTSWSWEFYESCADPETVRAAIELLRTMHLGQDTRPLNRIVRDRSDASCIEALLRTASTWRDAPQTPAWIPAIRDALVRLAGPETRAALAAQLPEIDLPTVRAILPKLGPLWTKELAPELIELTRRMIVVRRELLPELAEALARQVGPKGRAELLSLVASPEIQVQTVAWVALASTADAEELKGLLGIALAPSAARELAKLALEQHAAVIAADADLRNLATAHFVRGVAVEVLLRGWQGLLPADVRSTEVRKLVAALRSSKDGQVRTAAVMMLGYLRGPEVVAEIAPFLDDPKTKNNAILALQQTGERDAVPLIIECLRDPSEQTRAEAKQALEALELYFQAKERWEKR
jgi:HEAT repeat protein